MIDAMILDIQEQGRTPINIYLGRDQMSLFLDACRGHVDGCAGQSTSSGTFRDIKVTTYNFNASAVVISDR